MARSPLACLAVIAAVLALAVTADAQTQARSSSRTSASSAGGMAQSDLGGGAVGTGIADTTSGLTGGAQALRQADDLRGTSGRGEFLGAEDASEQFMGSEQQTTGQRGTQQRGLQGQSGRTTQRGTMRPGQGGAPAVRPTLSVGFAFTPQVSPTIGQMVRSSLQRIPSFGQTSSIRATIKESVVILEGTVGSSHAAMLAVQMAAMEPGVVRVDNRLTVAPQAPTTPSAGR